MRRLLKGSLAGALLGLAVFACEGALVMQQGAIGLDLPTDGPFAALFAAVRPLLPVLLARVALAYALGGAVLGPARGKAAWAAAFAVEWGGLAGGLAIEAAIERPALFDDLGWFRTALTALVAHGSPWHAWAGLGLWVGAHAVLWLRAPAAPATKVRWGRLAPLVAVLALAIYGATFLIGRGPLNPLTVMIGIDALRPDRRRSIARSRPWRRPSRHTAAC